MGEERLQLPHKVTLNERSKLSVTGVTEVVSFDDSAVVLHTTLGTLVVLGQELQLKQLSPEGGQVSVEGTVTALSYEEHRRGGFMQRLFGLRALPRLPPVSSGRGLWGPCWGCCTAFCAPCGRDLPLFPMPCFFWG